MNYQKPTLQDALAAEYVLGSMSYLVRKRFVRLLLHDTAMQLAVISWQNKLCPLYEHIAPRQPSPQVWQGIEQRLGFVEAKASFWSRLGFWRNFAVLNLCLTLILSVRLLDDILETRAYQAVMHDKNSQAAMLIQFDRMLDTVFVQHLTHTTVGKDHSLELWLVKDGAQPISLGLLTTADTYSYHLKVPLDSSIARNHLAITLEPAGGSPTHQPTGAAIFTGNLRAL